MSTSAPHHRDPDAVYRVVRIVAGHTDSWEAAAQAGIDELAQSIPDLRVARLARLDTVVRDGALVEYRVQLEASYRFDRRRSDHGEVVTVRRVLVVANETLGMEDLTTTVDARPAARTEFHLLAPVAPVGWGSVAVLGDPASGYVPSDVVTESREDSVRAAEQRVRGELRRLRDRGSMATGEVIVDDPVDAILRVLERGSFDEIIVSTLPSSVSRWLRMDLTSRLRRKVNLPITEITAR